MVEQRFSVFCEGIEAYSFSNRCFDSTNTDHCHDRYEITYLHTALGRYLIEGSEQKVAPGMLLLITPMSYHKVEIDPDVLAEGYTVYFNRHLLPRSITDMLDKLTDGKDGFGTVFREACVPDHLIGCFERLALAEGFSDDERTVYLQALLSEIIVLLSTANGKPIKTRDDELGARVAAFINSNIERSFSLERLARRFFVSKYYLCRAFKSYAGISPHAYINQKRILHAKGLIESGMTASGAAERVGFGDYSAFYRAYTKIVGKSPTAE